MFSLRRRLHYEFQHREKRDSGRLAGLRFDQLGLSSKSQKKLCLLLREVIAFSPSWNFYPPARYNKPGYKFQPVRRAQAKSLVYNRPLPSSKNPHFQNEARSWQPFLWKWVLFAWEWKMISVSKAEHVPSFWNRGSGELGSDLLFGPRKGIRIPESGKFLLVESGIQQIFAVESGIQLNESGIPLTIRIRNPDSAI